MKAHIPVLFLCLLTVPGLQAQVADRLPDTVGKVSVPAPGGLWTLDDCIRYALSHNLTIRQGALNVENSRVQLSTARLSRLPNLNASLGADASFGLSPSSNNVYVSSNRLSGSLGVSTSVPVFQGMQIHKQIKGSKLDLAAAVQDMKRIRDDVAINVMTLYLEALFSKELLGVAESQLALSIRQEQRSRELVSNGKQPESALYESKALRAKDELNLTQARSNLQLALLNLSQALNRGNAQGFDIDQPQLDSLTLESLHLLGSPDAVYGYAEQHLPHVKAEQLRLESRENAIGLAKSELYPSLSLSAGYNTGIYDTGEALWDQFRHNSREYVGISMSIPIFNRRAVRNNIRSARISWQSQQLALDEIQQSLRKEIEQAYYNADAAYEKYRSADAALASARIAFVYEQQKAEAGRSTVFDFNDAKTRIQKAESELIQAKFEFVFRSKILDYYRGIPIRL